jgi:hypothetical protein
MACQMETEANPAWRVMAAYRDRAEPLRRQGREQLLVRGPGDAVAYLGCGSRRLLPDSGKPFDAVCAGAVHVDRAEALGLQKIERTLKIRAG